MEKRTLSNSRNWLLLANYFAGYMFIYPLVMVVLGKCFPKWYNFLYYFIYVFTFIINIVLVYPILKEDIKEFKDNYFLKLKNIIRYLFINFGVEILMAIIISFFYEADAANQKEVEALFETNFLFTLFVSVIFAPIVEEAVFRVGILNKIQSKWGFKAALLISSFLFGLIHVYDAVLSGDFGQIWYLLYYGGIGYVAGVLYHENNDVVSTMLFHGANNLIAFMTLL